MAELDQTDLKILRVLQEDGRISILHLADRVGLSPTPCARRVKQLEAGGFIDRYVTLLNSRKLAAGLDVFVSVRLRSQAPLDCEKFERSVGKLAEVVGCYLLAGGAQYLLHVKVADVGKCDAFVNDKISIMDVVVETRTSIAVQKLKHTTAIALPDVQVGAVRTFDQRPALPR